MEIKIDDENYHLNELTDELEWCRSIRKNLFEKYPRLRKFLNDSFQKHNEEYAKSKQGELIDKLILANSKYIKDISSEEDLRILKEERFHKLLKTSINVTLPYVFELEKNIRLDRPFLYEPPNILSMYLLNVMQERMENQLNDGKYSDYEIYYLLLLNNIARSIKSSLILFSIGDDVHGYSLFRGIEEQLARAIMAESDNDAFVRSVKLNSLLQYKKSNPNSNDPELKPLDDYIEEYHLNLNKAENHILYGWVKRNGKPLTTAKDFMDMAFKEINNKVFQDFHHMTSEFIHEDYIAVAYNYINLRKQTRYFIQSLTLLVYQEEKEKGIKFSKYENHSFEVLKGFDSV